MYQKFGQQVNDLPISLFITYTLHPLPDRDRSRVANAGLGWTADCSVKLFVSEPPVHVIVLLIVWVRLSSDAGTFGATGVI